MSAIYERLRECGLPKLAQPELTREDTAAVLIAIRDTFADASEADREAVRAQVEQFSQIVSAAFVADLLDEYLPTSNVPWCNVALDERTPLDLLEHVVLTHLPGFDVQAVGAVAATMVANQIDGPPVWLLIIAPPSSGKTFVLEPLSGLLGATIVGQLTSSTLLSGFVGPKGTDVSLLTRLGARPCIVVKELGVLLEGHYNEVSDIFSQFRDIYDGQAVKDTGTGERREWKGKATMIAGMTGSIDNRPAFDSHLGERFLRFRFRSAEDPVELALRAQESVGLEAAGQQALHDAYERAFREAAAFIARVTLSTETRKKVANLSALLAAMRTTVERDDRKGDRVTTPPTTEGTARIAKQLNLFARAVAALRREEDLTDFSLIYRMTLDGMRANRKLVLERVVRVIDRQGYVTTADLDGLGVSTRTVYNLLEDLALVRVLKVAGKVEPENGKGRPATKYVLHPKCEVWMRVSGLREWLLASPETPAYETVGDAGDGGSISVPAAVVDGAA